MLETQLEPCKIVAELSCVHLGSMDRAKELISLAKICGADYAKFQKRNPIESVPLDVQNKPHPNTYFSYGNTYLEHRNKLEFNIEQHAELKKYCENIGIGYSCSVWDKTSVKEISSLKPDFIKVPSACNSNFELLDLLFSEFDGNIHISFGMLSADEKHSAINFLRRKGYIARTVAYHCTSEYPCPFEHLYLREIEALISYPFKAVGFSNHGYGIGADIIAYVFGATWIERHFVDDRTIKHTDASASLEPEGMRKLCRDLKNMRKAVAKKIDLSQEELNERKKLRGN